ncbi:lipid A deacylase LpxR family protein [Noviherbaspirillum aridicola]|uniref:Lipid A deacylase LpxR family protein n=1 Tax=Noviherbaspirillum aridicola TaxID=2849687 RepID=A0ABQ4Q8M0_9BURK|nr:lipid A deacylase LpxR family protein [Noviherbaspirillum aridicola]GIZ53553.1 hypothetical protein NCCP691_35670 [Noviherbaspirillum aridicola]
MRPISLIVSVLLLTGLQPPAHAQGFFSDFAAARERGTVTHRVDIDNDTLLMNRDDGFYSSGMRYTRLYSLGSGGGLDRFGWRLGQELYTASDIKLPPERVGPPDHPYAGWLYLGLFRETHRADGSSAGYGLDVGCIGPCAGGEWTQKNFHRLIDQPLPRGWSRQVRNEFGMVLHGQVTPVRWSLGSSADLAPTIHGRFGNIFTDAGVSLLARAGRLNQLPDQPTLHGFLRASVNAVAWNATLQGGYFSDDDPHTVRPERVVGELELGAVWQQGAWAARLGVVRRGNEIRGLSDSDGAQNFVRLQVSYTP